MTSLHRHPLTFNFTLYLLIGSFLFLFACEETEMVEDNNQLEVARSTEVFPIHLLNPSQADSLVKHYKQANGNLNQNFKYMNTEGAERKVMSYQMNDNQRVNFFHKLGTLYSDEAIDSVRLLIRVGFNNPQDSVDEYKTNFVPLLQFITNEYSTEPLVYPLRAYEPKVNWPAYECALTSGDLSGKREVHCDSAKLLINEWIDLAPDSITKQLYTYEPSLTNGTQFNKENRIRYYIFEGSDVEGIYDHYNLLKDAGDTCYFHLHLGLFNETEWIPLRNVLHLDDKDLSVDSVFESTNSTFFEFSAPCPKFCKDSIDNYILN